MITLYGFGPGFGLPEISPFVTKTEVQLMMAGLAFEKRQARPEDSPKGQVPFIDDDGLLVADSTFIRAHIERKYGLDYDEWLGPRGRAEAWAMERMVENHLTPAMAYFRWLDPENFDKGPAHFFDGVPEPQRQAVRSDVLSRVRDCLTAQGAARHSPQEVVQLGARSLAALSLFLGDQPFMTGRRLSGVDATVFGALAAILTPFFDSPLRERAEGFENLVAYTDRMMTLFYPEHPWARPQRAMAEA